MQHCNGADRPLVRSSNVEIAGLSNLVELGTRKSVYFGGFRAEEHRTKETGV